MNRRAGAGWPVIVVLAIAVNALMFGAIQYLVIDRQMRLSETTDFDIANFIRVHEQTREVRSRRNPAAPAKPSTERQQTLHRLTSAPRGASLSNLQVEVPKVDLALDTGTTVQIARELTPLVRVMPDYPERARAQMREGYVTLRFTVTETGSVADPEVIASEPPGYFDRAAIRAVLKWKYQPQLVDGKPVSVVTYTRLRFTLQEADQG